MKLSNSFAFIQTFLPLFILTLRSTQALSISEVWQSTYDKSRWYENVTEAYSSSLKFHKDPNVLPNIFPAPAQQKQPMLGNGVGITDSVALTLLDKVRANSEAKYWESLNMLFNQSDYWRAKGGAALNLVRSPLGSCDFSIAEYSFDDTYDNSADTNFTNFGINYAPKLFRVLQDVVVVNPDIKLFFAPWSGPSWMKMGASNNRTHGGTYDSIYYDAFATYLTKAMLAITEIGLTPYMLSLQNEPLFEPEYSGTLVLPEVAAIIGTKVRKSLDKAGLDHIGLTAYDHNWDRPDYPITVFNLTKPGTFQSVSWHCYAASPNGQEPFLLAYPETPQYFSECTRITQYGDEPYSNLKRNSVQLLTGSIEYGSRAVIIWNAMLEVDENGFTGPHLDGACVNCLAPLQVLTKEDGSLEMQRTSDYVMLAHGSLASRRFETPVKSEGHKNKGDEFEGAARKIGIFALDPNLVTQAFQAKGDQGCSRFSLTILNQNDRYETGVFLNTTANIFFRGQTASLDLPVGLTTVSWYASTEFYEPFECGPSQSEVESYRQVKEEEILRVFPVGDYSSEYVEENAVEFEVQSQMPLA